MGRKIFTALAILTACLTLSLFGSLLGIKASGIDSPLHDNTELSLSSAKAVAGINCQTHNIPVSLWENHFLLFNVNGELCWQGESAGKTLQVLLSGAGYGTIYWDFPYQADTYSYNRAALRQGYATFNFYRLGIGASDHPPGLLLNADSHARVLHQIIRYFLERNDYNAVVTLGHSLGSVIAIAHALNYPQDVSGIVLTGYAHNTNPDFRIAMKNGTELAATSKPFFGHIIDPSYILSKADSRQNTFYSKSNVDPQAIRVDELHRQTLTIGEIASMPQYFGAQTRELAVPVFQLLGEEDFVVCGGALDCTDHAAVRKHERKFFAAESCLETVVIDDTNHNANLHFNAQKNFALILDWIERRIGGANGTPPTQACASEKSLNSNNGPVG